jgi:A/G-specific adenine glycosylase
MRYKKSSPLFTRQLLQWNASENQRDMPWKGIRDPYRIWLSEVMLQQTRVEQGMGYYQRFTSAYPTVQDLANAPDADVFKRWEGLGYYNRCRNLLATARKVAFELNSEFPNTYEGLLALPGIGPYTAAAIASFAWNLPHAVVDGNVFRVLARYFGYAIPVDATEGKRWFQEQAQQLLPSDQPATYNQAIMDFGAVVCTPRQPDCVHCALSKTCIAFQENRVMELPVKAKAKPRQTRWMHYIIAEYQGQFLVRQRTEKDIWQGLYEWIPLHQGALLPTSTEALTNLIQDQYPGLVFRWIGTSSLHKQTLSHRDVKSQFVHIHLRKKPGAWADAFQWIEAEALSSLAFPRIIHQHLNQWRKKQ